ncbi:hypothetical protein ABZR88_19700 [Mucilaginibacter yixingensis]|nr:hypothetical protein [Mucilaginibacter yixingensis]
MMKKIHVLLLCAVVLVAQACKKKSDDTTTTTTTTTYLLSATFNSTAWDPVDTLSANVTYTAATKTKVLNITGTNGKRQLTFAITVNNATSTGDFPLGTYNVDANGNPSMVYSAAQTDANGKVTFVPVVAATQGNGTITISKVDATAKTITGTFSMNALQTNYDGNGNIVSITNTSVTGGAINAMPYTVINK